MLFFFFFYVANNRRYQFLINKFIIHVFHSSPMFLYQSSTSTAYWYKVTHQYPLYPWPNFFKINVFKVAHFICQKNNTTILWPQHWHHRITLKSNHKNLKVNQIILNIFKPRKFINQRERCVIIQSWSTCTLRLLTWS